MIPTLIVLVLAVVTVLVLLFLDGDEVSEQASLDQVRDELLVADQRIECEYHQARRAMNDAAGQSWRNLAG